MGKKLKICFISGVISRSGGTERVGILIANELAERGYDEELFWVFGRRADEFQYSDKIRVAGLLNPVSEGKLFRTYIYPIIKLHQFIKKNQFDIVIDIDTLLSHYAHCEMRENVPSLYLGNILIISIPKTIRNAT